jgi:hypothetical protein
MVIAIERAVLALAALARYQRTDETPFSPRSKKSHHPPWLSMELGGIHEGKKNNFLERKLFKWLL